MNREEKIVKLKLDVIFKRVFGNAKNEKIIAAFISDLLEIPRESIRAIYISNVELTPEYLDQKFSRLDLKLNVDGRIVNIEMQVNREPDFKERTLFYWAKLYSEELDAGEEYGELKQTICINIINFELFDCEDYHSKFELLESQRKELMTNKLAIHFFELRKLSKFKRNRRMEDWLQLIDAETDDDYRERIKLYLAEDAVNCNEAQYKQWALEVAGVKTAVVKDASTVGAGNVGVYIASTTGTVSQDLLDAVSEYIEERQFINANLIVSALTSVQINTVARIVLKAGHTLDSVSAEYSELLTAYLDTVTDTVSYFRASDILYNCSGVDDVLTFTLNGDEESIGLDDTEIAVLGGVNIGT